MRRVVTIDGPAGAGKSTVARRLADRLGWRLLDTGAMYRAVALAAIRAGVDLASDADLGALADRLEIRLPDDGRVWINDQEITSEIRSLEVTRNTSRIADSPSVRRRLATWQRAFAAESDTVTEGRDQGTVVFPDAPCKFFLVASIEERARRRHAEFVARGESITIEAVLLDMKDRDARDEARAIAPMRAAEDARVVDSTGLELESVVAMLERTVREVMGLDLERAGHGT